MLDCVQDHEVYIYERGGENRLGKLNDIESVKWTRLVDDISACDISLSTRACSAQADLINFIEPGRHEFRVYRGGEQVWEGPVTRQSDTAAGIAFSAKDVMHYTERLIMRAAYNNAYPNIITATQRALNVLTGELTRKDTAELAVGLPSVNMLPYVEIHPMTGEAQTSASTLPYQFYVADHIRDLCINGGINYTVIGRATHLWDTSFGLGQAPLVTEKDFLGVLNVTSYGMELATYDGVSDGQGGFGDSGGVDDYYGLVERLTPAYGIANNAPGAPLPTQAALVSQAVRDLVGRNPTPVQVRIPDNSSLNPNGALSISDLVPGNHIPLRANIGVRVIEQMQKLKSVTVTEDSTGEKIGVVMYPASGVTVVSP